MSTPADAIFLNFTAIRCQFGCDASYSYRATALTFRLPGSDATVITLAHRQHDGWLTDFFYVNFGSMRRTLRQLDRLWFFSQVGHPPFDVLTLLVPF